MGLVAKLLVLLSSLGFCAYAHTDTTAPELPTHRPYKDSHFYSRQSRVNLVTGEYCEEACDLIVAGVQLLSYRRFYHNLGLKEETHGHWQINPETQVLLNCGDCLFQGTPLHRYLSVGNARGGALLLKGGGQVTSKLHQ